MAVMVSNREKAMLVVVAILLLYAAVGSSLRSRLSDISDLRNQRERARRELQERRELVSRRQEWADAYAERADMMPVFPAGRRVETLWMEKLGTLASSNNVTLVKCQVGSEKEVDGVFELSIDFDCDGQLEAFIPFLHAVYSEGAMLDIRKLTLRPQNGKGAGGLRASATLCCVYMRSDDDDAGGR